MKVTLGNLIDQLTIANIRIWMAANILSDSENTDEQVAAAARIANATNKLRSVLIQEIDEELNEIASGKLQKLHKQSKTYGKKP
jgi:hypothetical protein